MVAARVWAILQVWNQGSKKADGWPDETKAALVGLPL